MVLTSVYNIRLSSNVLVKLDNKYIFKQLLTVTEFSVSKPDINLITFNIEVHFSNEKLSSNTVVSTIH